MIISRKLRIMVKISMNKAQIYSMINKDSKLKKMTMITQSLIPKKKDLAIYSSSS